MPLALDSSFLVDLERGLPAAVQCLARLEVARERIAVPAPALYEILAAALVRRGGTGARKLEAVLGRFPVLPVDRESARRSAEIRAELVALGREKPHIDVLIAGVALRFDSSLLTRDQDFRDISETTGLRVTGY